MAGKLKKGIFIVFLANSLNLGLSILRNLILPHYLSVETYADIKLYQLYISYIGFAAIGYIDGMYLKYGGQDVSRLNRIDLQNNISTFRWIELFFTIVVSIVGIVLNDNTLLLTGITIFFVNITDYYKCFFQATGEFGKYTKIMNISSILLFSTNLLLLFVWKCDIGSAYIISYIVIYGIIWLITEVRFARLGYAQPKVLLFSAQEAKYSISSGFLLMCGLSISNLMTGLDRWCVKYFMTTYDFALYAFAASIEGFLSFAVSPIAVTLYNYFCVHDDIERNKDIKGQIHIFLAYIISGAFVVKFIMEIFLQKYANASRVLFILFAGQFVYGLIKCFYLNIFKAQKRQNELFRLTSIILVIGIVLNIALYQIMHVMEAFAIGTLFSSIIWFFICERMFPMYRDSLKSILYSAFIIYVFLLLGLKAKSYVGFFSYIVICTIISYLFKKTEFIELFKIAKDLVKKIIRKRG